MIRKGIILHREIDTYTDSHKIVGQSKDRLRDKYRHYSGVITDMFYDHFLSKNFTDYHPEPIADFTQWHYDNLMSYLPKMPKKAQHMLPYMVRGNWLVGYGQMEGLHRALSGMTRRTKFDSRMNESIQELAMFYDEFEAEFRAFFTELEKHISQFREDLITS
jgi:acyl carrier protein phosphodiesterase